MNLFQDTDMSSDFAVFFWTGCRAVSSHMLTSAVIAAEVQVHPAADVFRKMERVRGPTVNQSTKPCKYTETMYSPVSSRISLVPLVGGSFCITNFSRCAQRIHE